MLIIEYERTYQIKWEGGFEGFYISKIINQIDSAIDN